MVRTLDWRMHSQEKILEAHDGLVVSVELKLWRHDHRALRIMRVEEAVGT